MLIHIQFFPSNHSICELNQVYLSISVLRGLPITQHEHTAPCSPALHFDSQVSSVPTVIISCLHLLCLARAPHHSSHILCSSPSCLVLSTPCCPLCTFSSLGVLLHANTHTYLQVTYRFILIRQQVTRLTFKIAATHAASFTSPP